VGTRDRKAGEIVEVVSEGELPPWDCLILHPDARLSDADTQALVDGLSRTFGAAPAP
jgi:cytochrome c551/c552